MSGFLDGLAMGCAVAAATAFLGAIFAYRFIPPQPRAGDSDHPTNTQTDGAIPATID